MKSSGYVALATLCLLALPFSTRAETATPRFQLDDLQKIVSLADPRISPDGKRVAMIVSTPDWKSNKRQQEIDLVDVASRTRRTLAWKREKISSPRWSPDGNRLAFLAKDEQTKHAQLYVMPMDGGDAMRITDARQGVDSYGWSTDGTQLAFISADEAANAKAIKAHDDAFQVTDKNFLARTALNPAHLWLVPSGGGTAKRLTEGSYSLQTDQQDDAPAPAWSRDGHGIAFTRFPGPYWGPSFHSVIDSVGVAGGTPANVVTEQGAMDASFAPAGR